MKSQDTNKMTYDFLCFSDLAYEFHPDESKATENKIKRKLRYYSLGSYNQDRVNYIRVIRNDLFNEITQFQSSRYYKGPTGKYAEPDDFDVERLKHDFLEKYPLVTEDDMGSMINFAIYLFYLR